MKRKAFISNLKKPNPLKARKTQLGAFQPEEQEGVDEAAAGSQSQSANVSKAIEPVTQSSIAAISEDRKELISKTAQWIVDHADQVEELRERSRSSELLQFVTDGKSTPEGAFYSLEVDRLRTVKEVQDVCSGLDKRSDPTAPNNFNNDYYGGGGGSSGNGSFTGSNTSYDVGITPTIMTAFAQPSFRPPPPPGIPPPQRPPIPTGLSPKAVATNIAPNIGARDVERGDEASMGLHQVPRSSREPNPSSSSSSSSLFATDNSAADLAPVANQQAARPRQRDRRNRWGPPPSQPQISTTANTTTMIEQVGKLGCDSNMSDGRISLHITGNIEAKELQREHSISAGSSSSNSNMTAAALGKTYAESKGNSSYSPYISTSSSLLARGGARASHPAIAAAAAVDDYCAYDFDNDCLDTGNRIDAGASAGGKGIVNTADAGVDAEAVRKIEAARMEKLLREQKELQMLEKRIRDAAKASAPGGNSGGHGNSGLVSIPANGLPGVPATAGSAAAVGGTVITLAERQADLYRERLREYEELAALCDDSNPRDTVEDAEKNRGVIEGGTWEHRKRAKEMLETARKNLEITMANAGRHHIADFMPPEVLDAFLRNAHGVRNSATGGGEEKGTGTGAGGGDDPNKIGDSNIGFQLLKKSGWEEGSGLGAEGGGIKNPLSVAKGVGGVGGRGGSSTAAAASVVSSAGSDIQVSSAGAGVGVKGTHEVESSDDAFDMYRKRMMLAYRFRPNPMNNPRRDYY